ncbi:hypothetical protein AXF42_Ash002117 [Apostasia shenzhenica]|uniref:Uncharacterized protein n=1 Tax=Apostasia shenzhenica TaxID=1088818 RepID=A0A2I0AMP7_9ASPA|nr:hypothetical protein AXF42_Ash002117 [Apostasia shenzhenica]
MLRAKQIGTFSQCARSFYLSGSRCNNGDSAPCASTEDENHASRRKYLGNISKLFAFPSSDVLRESKFTVDHLVKLGPTPSTREAVSCNASVTVKHVPSDPQSFSVDFRRPISAKKSSDEKPQNQPKYSKIQTNSSNSTSWRFDSSSSTHSGPPDGSVKSGKMKFKQNWNSNCMKDQKIQSKLLNVHGHRLNIPQSGKFHSDSFVLAEQFADNLVPLKGLPGLSL